MPFELLAEENKSNVPVQPEIINKIWRIFVNARLCLRQMYIKKPIEMSGVNDFENGFFQLVSSIKKAKYPKIRQ